MTRSVMGFMLAIGLAQFSALPAFAQTIEDPTTKAPAPVAYVYIQTTPGVMAFAVAANGALTKVLASPFKVSGQMEGISGKLLISVGNTYLHTYPIESNGAIAKQNSQINTADYNGSNCGTTSGQGSVLDHTGKYLYVQLNSHNADSCAAWQTYQVRSDGRLEFIGGMAWSATDENGDAISSNVPTIASNDKFAYGVFQEGLYTGNYYCENYYLYCPYFSTFVRGSNGVLLANLNLTETDPEAQSGWAFYPSSLSQVQADPGGHLAVAVVQLDGRGNSYEQQLASYTINPSTGAISSSSNSYWNMPFISLGLPFAMSMSPSGKLVAMGGHQGLQVFHFNGANPATTYSNVLLPRINIDQLKWDNSNHLYALSYDSAQLYVFTATPTNITQAPGSPYKLPNHPYGTRGMVVIP